MRVKLFISLIIYFLIAISVKAAVKTSVYFDGSPMDRSKCDGVVYKFIKGNYYFSEPLNGILNVKSFGAIGNGIADDSEAIQKAVRLPYDVHFPKGIYKIKKYVKLAGGRTYYGVGAEESQIVLDTEAKYGFGGAGGFYVQSSSPETYIINTTIRNLGFRGLAKNQGHSQFTHLLAIAGTDNTLIADCSFTDFRGDGLFVSAGLSYIELSKDLRKNKNLTVKDCHFNGGGSFTNRNGISLSDVDGAQIINCVFESIGNTMLSRSVGAIDLEVDQMQSTLKNILIAGCRFNNISSLNTAAIARMQHSKNIKGLTIRGNTFSKCYWGIVVNSVINNDFDMASDDDVSVENNIFENIFLAILASGKEMNIVDNKFFGSEEFPSSVQLGTLHPLINSKVKNNTFHSTGRLGSIVLNSLYNVSFEENIFINPKGFGLFFFLDTDTNMIFKNVEINRNITEAKTPLLYFGNGFNKTKFIHTDTFIISGNGFKGMEKAGATINYIKK